MTVATTKLRPADIIYHRVSDDEKEKAKEALINIGGIVLDILVINWVLKPILKMPQANLRGIQNGNIGASWEWRF